MSPSLAALVASVDAVVGVPVEGLCAAELQALIPELSRQADRLTGWVNAAAGQLSAMTGGRVATEDGGARSVSGWLAEATRASSESAGSRLSAATKLRLLPLVVQAVLDGVITPEHARVLTRFVGRIDDAALIESQPLLISVAAGRDPLALGKWVSHEIATHCEPARDADEASAVAKRHLQITRNSDGSIQGRFRLAAGDGEPLVTGIEALARKQGNDDDRTAGQRRADALTELAEQALRHGDLPESGGQRPQISYVLPADWAARQDARSTCPTCSACLQHRPVTFTETVRAAVHAMPGGPVPAEWACATAAWTGPATRARTETLLCDARISRVLLDIVGQVKGLEALRDSVTPTQCRALAARDGRCIARGCTRPPAACDAHHLRHRADGGPTTLDNLVLLCRRHHVLWHLGKLTLADLHVPPGTPTPTPPDHPAPDPPPRAGQAAAGAIENRRRSRRRTASQRVPMPGSAAWLPGL